MSITFYLREIYHEFLLVMYMFIVEEKHNNSENDQLICCILKQQVDFTSPEEFCHILELRSIAIICTNVLSLMY